MSGNFDGASAWAARKKERAASFDGAASWAARKDAHAQFVERADEADKLNTPSTSRMKERVKATSPMFRQQPTTQQNVVTPKNQSTLAQNLGKGALQQREAKNYQSESAFNQHVQDVKPKTTMQRVGNTLKGAADDVKHVVSAGAKGSAGSYLGAAGLFNEINAAVGEAVGNLIGNPEKGKRWKEEAGKIAAGNYETGKRLTAEGQAEENLANYGKGPVGKFVNTLGVNTVQMGGDALLAPVAGGYSLIPLAVRAGGSAALESSDSGASLLRRAAYSVGTGGVEALTEKLSDGLAGLYGAGAADEIVEDVIAKLSKSEAGQAVLKTLFSATGEGLEEVISDFAQPALQTIYNGKSIGENYSAMQASDVLYDFLVGAALGGIGGGVEVAANRFARFDNSLGESGRKAIRGSYQEGKDTAEHVKDFIPAYNAGVEGKANPNPTNETAYAGYVAGQNDAKTEARKKTFAQESDGGSGLVYDDYVSRSMDNATADEINTVAKALGVRVRMADGSEVRGGTANGVIEGNEIRIAKDAQDPVMQVVGHEWTHRVQELAPEQYTAFRNAIMEDPDVAEAANILHEQYNRMGVETSMDEALDEAAANYAGEMIANTDVLNEFIRRHSEDRTLLEKLRDAIREIVGKLTGKAKKQAQTAEGLLQQAFEAAARSSKNAAGEGGVRFDLKGKNKDGIEVYETGEDVKKMSYKERKEAFMDIMRNEYAGRTAKFSDGSNTYYAKFDEADLRKNMYGDKKSSQKGWKAKINTGADGSIFELVENAKHSGSSSEQGKTSVAHKGVTGWEYFVKTVQIDGQVYDLLANVRKKPDGEFVYSIQLNENKNKASAPPLQYQNGTAKANNRPVGVSTNALESSVPQNGENVKKRYSLKEDSTGRELTEQQQEYFKDSEVRDKDGRLLVVYHGTPSKGFTVFDAAKETDGALGKGFYFSASKEYARGNTIVNGAFAGTVIEAYLDIKNPYIAKYPGGIDTEALKAQGHDGVYNPANDFWVAFSPEQVKSVANETPTKNSDIRYSLKTYTDEEKKQHRKDADEYFGHTYKWSETGYILTNGKKLDFSGRHEGGPGGYRTVDHRDIRDALGDDYGGSDYSGSMVQFMSEGNIRISPESGGINLSVMPTKNQLDSLSDFISHNRGEVILDLDTPDGQTVSSTEYPRGTHANKVLADIKAYFEDGTTPQVSSLAQFLSLKGTENAQELAALKRENETLRQRVDYWKGQTRRSDGVRTDSKSVQQAAKKLVKDYSAEIDSSEIAGDLASLYDYIARGGDETGELTYTEARSRADSIAERIAESAIAKDDEVYREYSELRKYLKDTKLTLSAEDAAGITDYADLRRGLFGKVNLGKGEHTNVDQVYSELAESYPEFFSETRENNVSDQISRIAEVANELYNVGEYNPFEGYMGQAVSAISNDIMERFFDLPQAKKTFADVQAEKLDAAKAAGRKAAADAKLAGQMAQGRTDAVRLRRTQEALQKARTQQAEKLDALKDRYREKDATRREGQKRRELRAKITRHAKDLSKKLLRPTDTKHIPENMRSAVAAVLNSINQESAYEVEYGKDGTYQRVKPGESPYSTPTQRTEAFRALQEQYQSILKDNEGGDMVIDPSLLGTDGSDGLIGQVVKMGDRRLSELTREELGTMWKAIRAVEHSVSTAGKVLSKSKFETTKQMADAFKTDVRTRRQKLGGNMTISLETPYTFFAHYGETGKSIYRMLRNAQDSQEVMARDIAEKTQKVLGDELGEAGFKDVAGKAIHGDLKGALRDARGSAIGKWEAETHDITVANGGKLTLTTPQIMELYLLSKRKQALGHLLGGGVIQPEIKSAETGKTKVQRGTQQVFLTEGDIERITGKLTDEQKRVADGLQDLTATTLAKYGNDASMQAYGYRKFTEKNYWPIKSAKEGLHSTQEKDSGNVRSIKNIGMAQQVTPNANNAVELRSVFDTFADHASDMIDYAAWLAPMEDANRFFNFQYRNDAGDETGVSVKGLLDEKGGNGAQQYWTKLMGDIQNGIGAKDFEPMTDKFAKGVGKFKGAAVGANIRVVIQQPTAFFRAAAVLDPKDMAKGMTGGVTKGSGWEKALEHSPIAMRKDVGSFDISSPYTLKERFYGKEGVTNKLNDLAGAAAGKADAVTWGKLWNACEWQVKREKPDVRAGSNEFYSAVNDVFSDMIDQTQVVDGILQRSNIMRGKSTLSQQATAFMGEPIMSLNVLMRSYDAFRYEENPAKRSKALKNVGRAATALVVTNVVNALAQSVVDGLRDDDRDKDYWEKFLSAFTGVEGDENNALELISHVTLDGNVGSNMNPVAQIPFAKDVLSLVQGYDVSRPDMEVFSDLVDATKTFIDSAGGSGKKTRKEATLTLLAAASKMFGLPVYNIKRDLSATLRTAAQASGSLAYQYEVEKFSYNLENSSNKNRFISILYDALEQGDYTTYEHIRRDLMEQMGLDGESIQSSLKTRYKKKTESEENYSLPQKSLDLLGTRGKYAYDSGEGEEKFSAADLNASAYSKYETQKGETYRTQADKATSSGAFSRLSDEGKDKALGYVESYAEAVALKENSGGQYEITTKWIQNAQEAQKQYRIAPGVFAACRAAASECESLKDTNGDSIDLSKGLQIMEMLFRSGLNEQQRTAMYEYLSVPKRIRHWNRARVDEQLAIMRKKAA